MTDTTRITDVVIDAAHKRNLSRSKQYKSYGRVRGSVWPSQTSISINGAVCGSCMRNLYYKMIGVIGSEADKYMIPKWERGIYIEKWYQDILGAQESINKAGYDFKLLGNNVKFSDEQHSVSGEFDAIGILNGEPIGIEFKTIGAFWQSVNETISGYNATAKESAMFQVMRYLHWTQNRDIKLVTMTNICDTCNGTGTLFTADGHKRCYDCDNGYNVQKYAKECLPDEQGLRIKKWRILYWMSGEQFAEYEIELSKNGELVMYSWDRKGIKTKKIFKEVTIERIIERQNQLLDYVHNRELPPRDYESKYTKKYEIINRISALNRKIGACNRRKGISNPESCTQEKIDEDREHLSSLEAELATEKRNLSQAFREWRSKVWMIHPPKFESWSEANKHVGDWQCKETICPYRELCDKDWNIPMPKVLLESNDGKDTE